MGALIKKEKNLLLYKSVKYKSFIGDLKIRLDLL